MVFYIQTFLAKQYFIGNLTAILDLHFSTQYNHLILGDFNVEQNNPHFLTPFIQFQSLIYQIKSKICLKRCGTCVNFIHANRKYCFKNF